MNKIGRILSLIVAKYFFILSVLFVFSIQSVFAAPGINQQINFQGKVVNKGVGVTNGTNVPNGNYDFQFRIYDAPTGGTLLWTENWNVGTTKVYVNSGIFSVALGTYTSLSPAIDFNTDNLYLSVNYNNDGEMTPRVRLSATPYALNAQKVGGLTVTNTNSTLTVANNKTITFGESFTTTGVGITLDQNLSTTSSPKFSGLTITSSGIGVTGNSVFTNNVNIGGGSTITGNLNVGGTIFGQFGGSVLGNISLNQILSGTNVSQNLVIGNGSTLSYIGTGRINASHLGNSAPSAFLNIGSTGNFITNLSLGPSGLIISGSGIGRTITNSGLIDVANGTLTRSGSVGSYTVGLNLGSTNTWTGAQTFGNISVGGTFLSVGSTNLVTNLNSQFLGGYSAPYFVNIGQTGNYISNISIGPSGLAISGTGIGRTITNTGLLDSANGTLTRSGSAGYYRIGLNLASTNTWTATQTFSNATAGRFYQSANGIPTSNLGSPSVTEMALFSEQFNNKTEFYNINNVFVETSTDGIGWSGFTVTDTQKRMLLGGDSSSNLSIPYGTTYFRIRFLNSSYVYLNALYSYWSSNGHTSKVQIYKKHNAGAYTQHTSSTTDVSAWPGHLYLPFSTIPFQLNGTLGTHYDEVSVVFIPTWNGTYPANNISLYKLQLWGGYPAGKRNLYATDEYGNVTFPGNINTSKNVTIGGTLVSVGSTNLVTNLNSQFLGGYSAPYFVNIGQTGQFVSVGSSGSFISNISLGVSGLSISGTGIGRTLTNTGLVDISNGTLTRSGSAGLYTVGLNLGSTNTWTGAQTFGNITVGGTFLSVGSTNQVTNLNANYLNGQSSSYFLNIGHTGTFVGVGSSGNFISNISLGPSGLAISGTGIGRTLTNTGLVDITNTTLLRSGSAGSYTVGLNLGSTNTWTGAQTFGNISIGASFLSVGGTNLVTNLNANYLNGQSSSYFVNIGQTGNFITNLTAGSGVAISGTGIGRTLSTNITNGLRYIGASIGLGGTLSQATALNLSTNSFRILGNGNTEAFYIGSNGNVGMGNTNPQSKLDILGSLAYRSTVGNYHYKNLASYTSDIGVTVGMLKITMPKSWSNTMGVTTIKGYDFDVGGDWEVIVSGYNYNTVTPTWLNYNAEIKGDAPFNLVRLAYDVGTSKNVILIGTTATVWNYPKAEVTDFYATYGGQAGWGTGWSISLVQSEVGIASSVTPVLKTYLATNGNFGINTTNPTSKFHVVGNGNFSTNLAVGATLSVTGRSVLSQNLTVNAGGIGVTGNSLFTNNLTIGGTMTAGRGVLNNGLYVVASGIAVTGNSVFSNNLTIGGTLISVGSTNLVTNLNANYLNGQSSSYFVNIGQTGNFITNLTAGSGVAISGTGIGRTLSTNITNGLRYIGASIGLGGTLSQATALNLSTNSFRILGNGNTEAFYIGSNGNVGVGTTNQTAKLTVMSKGDTAVYGANILTADGTFTAATGWTTGGNWTISGGLLNHTAGASVGVTGTSTAISTTTTYQIGFTATTTNSTFKVSLGGVDSGLSIGTTGTASYYIYIKPINTSGNIIITPTDTNYIGSIDNIFIRQVTSYNSAFAILNTDSSVGLEIRTSNISSSPNLFIGIDSGKNNTTGSQNTSLGSYALANNFTGSKNASFGSYSLFYNSAGNENSAMGYRSLYSNISGDYNVAMGANSLLLNTSGYYNTAIGNYTLGNNLTGSNNSAIGNFAMLNNVNGNRNSALGNYSLRSNISGSDNSAFGNNSLYTNTTGSNNVAMGNESLYNANDSMNTAIGYRAGYKLGTGSSNVFIGIDVGASGNFSNKLFIGKGATPAIYGDLTTGNIGMGTTNPNDSLHVYKSSNNAFTFQSNTSSLRFLNYGGQNFIQSGIALSSDSKADIRFTSMYGITDWMIIKSNNGFVGIGTTNPQSKLEVVDTATQIVLRVGSSAQSNYTNLYLDSNSGSSQIFRGGASYSGGWGGINSLNLYNSNGAIAFHPNSVANALFLANNGNIGIGTSNPTSKLTVRGTTCLDLNADGICTDNTAAISDARLKTNVTTLESALDIVEKLRGVRFNWNGQNSTGTAESLGYIAQEVEQILPELVITDSNGYKNVDYSKIVAVATNAIQEQQLQLDDLKSKLIISSEGQIAVNMNVSEEVLNSLGYDGVKNEIENATYLLSDPVTGTVTMIGNFASATVGKLTAGLIRVTNIIADNILVKALTARLVKTDKLEVSLLTPMGNASAINVEGDLDINGNLKVLGAHIDDLQSNTASVSTLYADNIISPEGSMSAVMNNKVTNLRNEIQNLLNLSSESSSDLINQSTLEAQRLSNQLTELENSLSQGMVDQQNQIAILRDQLQQLTVLNSTTTVDTTNLVSKSLTVSVPYSGALFIKDGSSTTDGVMSTDNTLNIGGIGWKNYYQWTTSSSQIQDNTILFKITLPDNFITWDSGECPGQNCPFEINYQTGTSLTEDNNISFKLFNENDLMNNIICSSYNNSSIVWNKLTCNQSQLQNNVISQWDTAGETSVVMIKMASKNTSSAFSRVSDIILRYKSKP